LGVEGEEILVRRHLAASGKNRIYINGGPTTLGLLAQLGDHLVHIYGQHEQSLLLRPASHLDLLDRYGELQILRQRVTTEYDAYQIAVTRLAERARSLSAAAQRREQLEFQ